MLGSQGVSRGRTRSATLHREHQETAHSPVPGGYLKLHCTLGGGDTLPDLMWSASAFNVQHDQMSFSYPQKYIRNTCSIFQAKKSLKHQAAVVRSISGTIGIPGANPSSTRSYLRDLK